jgi:hypothetical protein
MLPRRHSQRITTSLHSTSSLVTLDVQLHVHGFATVTT